jgi:hypothetical protein
LISDNAEKKTRKIKYRRKIRKNKIDLTALLTLSCYTIYNLIALSLSLSHTLYPCYTSPNSIKMRVLGL